MNPPFKPYRQLPKVSVDPRDFVKLRNADYLGADYEWRMQDNVPTLIGLSNGRVTVSTSPAAARPYLKLVIESAQKLVGHNFIAAERPIFQKLGFNVPLAKCEDTILRYWLTNMHLCKSSNKSSDDDDPKGRGYMNLWCMISQYTNAWNYKECRGEHCTDACPEHFPQGYNGLDARFPVDALPGLLRHSQVRGVDGLYPLHAELAEYLVEVRDRGVRVDVPYVAKLRDDFLAMKLGIWDEDSSECLLHGKFNPESPKQVKKYFAEKGIEIENTQESTVRTLWQVTDDPDLRILLDWKELGDGVDRWFAPREWNESKGKWTGYVDENGVIHPRLGFFTSSGRLQCTSPNLQNVAKRRIDRVTGEKVGKKIRRAIIPPEDHYLIRADYKGAENRAFMHLAGYRNIPATDFHTWAVGLIGIKETDEFSIKLGGAREAAKSGIHATDYGEGLSLVSRSSLNSTRIVNEVAAGARLVFPDWTFEGQVVTFTGSNFAKRAFGDASYENRAKALSFAVKYFRALPKLRELQKQITRQIERDHAVRTPLGYYLLSYGDALDRIKTALAVYGSQPVAHFTKLAMLRCKDDARIQVILQVHDELLFTVHKRYPPKLAKKWVEDYMCGFDCEGMVGLRIPIDCEWGETWATTKPIN